MNRPRSSKKQHVLVHEGVAPRAEAAPAEPARAEEGGGLGGRAVGRVPAEPGPRRRGARAVRRQPLLLLRGAAGAAERGQPVLAVAAVVVQLMGHHDLLVLHHGRQHFRGSEFRQARRPPHRVPAHRRLPPVPRHHLRLSICARTHGAQRASRR
jgi:hypothetical protein